MTQTHDADSSGPPVPEPPGFDVAPGRPVWMTVVLFVAVVFGAAGFAHLFRDSGKEMLDWYAGSDDPTASAAALHGAIVFVVVMATVVFAAWLGGRVEKAWGDHVGVEAVAASARNEGRRISQPATVLRAIATWSVSAGMVSIGRESAIIESGGAMGAVAGRRFRGRGDVMAAVGIASAFAAAYHAPLAGILYVQEHLQVHKSRRALKFVVLGALAAHLVSIELMGGHPIFPGVQGSQANMLKLGLIALLPAAIVARIFLQLRVSVGGGALAERLGMPRWVAVMGLAAIAAAAVTAFPLAAGNGMEALRHGAVDATWSLAIALLIGKLVGTTAALGAGAPGGVLTPTISISAGAALVTLLTAQSLGLGVEHLWDALIMAMAIGLAVGLRSRLGAVFMLPEMVGDYRLVPVVGVIVGLAVVIDLGLDAVVRRLGERVPTGVYDEDA